MPALYRGIQRREDNYNPVSVDFAYIGIGDNRVVHACILVVDMMMFILSMCM